MSKRYLPGATIGMIGNSAATALLAQAAGKLGYRVASLVTEENNPVRQFANWQTITENYNEKALTYFANRIDLMTSEIGLLTHQHFQQLKPMTDIVLSDDLIALTTDRLLEKNFFDKHNCLIAPFSLVTSIRDIEEAVEYLGFPCVLKETQRYYQTSREHLILYSAEDFPEAEERLATASCILEAWIPVEHQVSVTAVRNERGEILLYPIFETGRQIAGISSYVQYPANINEAIAEEIYRISRHIVENLELTGTMTLRFFVTSAGVIYVNEASIGLNEEAMFTLGSMSMSHFEATVRGLVGLPLPDLRIRTKAAIALPLEQLNLEKVLTQYMLRTDWEFVIFNKSGGALNDFTGQVIVTGDSLSSCQRQIEITELI